MDADSARVDVEPAVNGQLVTHAYGDPLTQLRVVVEFQLIAQAVLDVDLLMVSDATGRRHRHGNKGHFGACTAICDVGVQGICIRLRRLYLKPQPDRHENCDRENGADSDREPPAPRPATRLTVTGLARQTRLSLLVMNSRRQAPPLAPSPPIHGAVGVDWAERAMCRCLLYSRMVSQVTIASKTVSAARPIEGANVIRYS